MRVRISYSVDLDDVPGECARMMLGSLEHLNEIHRELESLVDTLDSKDAVAWQIKDKIDRCRKRLAKLDSILQDNDMILDGYYVTKQTGEVEDVASEGRFG